MRQLWMLEPIGELVFGGDIIFDPRHELCPPTPIGPVSVKVTWNAASPEGTGGEILGDPAHAKGISYLLGGRAKIVGKTRFRSTVIVKDVFFTTVQTSEPEEYGPRLLARFVAGDLELRAENETPGEQLQPPEVLFLIPDDPVWHGFSGRFGFEPHHPIEPPIWKFEMNAGALKVATTHLVYSGGAEFGGSPGRGQRIGLAVAVTGQPERPDDIDLLIETAEPIVNDLMLVAGLAAKRPLHVLGGYASAVKDTPTGRVHQSVEFTRSRSRHPVRMGRSFNDVQMEGEAFLTFLGTAMRTLSKDRGAAFLRVALQSYLASLYRAFNTQQFLSVCTAIEAIKEWHSRRQGWDKLLSEKQKSSVREYVRKALAEAEEEGHLPRKVYVEARAKVAELFRPRISVVLNEIVEELRIRADDLFDRDKATGHCKFDFLTVRNNLLHQGKVPENQDHFHNVGTRTRYFAERLLFAVLGHPPGEFLKLQHEVAKQSSGKLK